MKKFLVLGMIIMLGILASTSFANNTSGSGSGSGSGSSGSGSGSSGSGSGSSGSGSGSSGSGSGSGSSGSGSGSSGSGAGSSDSGSGCGGSGFGAGSGSGSGSGSGCLPPTPPLPTTGLECVVAGFVTTEYIQNCTSSVNGSNGGLSLCDDSQTTLAENTTGCPANYTNYCGTYTQSGLRSYTKAGTPSMFLQLLTGKFQDCLSAPCTMSDYTRSYWFLGNKSKANYSLINGGYVNFSAPGSAVYTEGVWMNYADGDVNNASLLINTDFEPSDMSTWFTDNYEGGYAFISTGTSVHVTCTTPLYTTAITTVAGSTIPAGTNPPSQTTQVELTLSGDFTTLTTAIKTALIAAIKLLFTTLSSGLSVSDIKEIILSAGSIKATIVFNSDVDNTDIVAAVDSIDETPPTIMNYTITGVSQPVLVDNGAAATQSQVLGLVTACVLTYIFA